MEKLNRNQSGYADLEAATKSVENSSEFSSGNPFAKPKVQITILSAL